MDLDYEKVDIRLYDDEKDSKFVSELIQKNFDKSYIYHNKPDRLCLLVEYDEMPIGFVDWEYTSSVHISKHYANNETKCFFAQFFNKRILYIHSIAIVPEFQRKGIGAYLTDIVVSGNGLDQDIVIALALQDSSGHINSEKLFDSFHFKRFDPIADAWDQSESLVNNCPLCEGTSVCKCSAVPFVKFLREEGDQ